MNTARVSLGLAILLSWTLVSPTFAQQFLPPGQAGFDPGTASVGDYGAEAGVDDMQTRSVFGSGLFDNRNYMLRTDAGDGLGYLRGFQTFAAFQPIVVTPDEFIFWMSPRGYVTFDTGVWAGNLGAGFRWLNPNNNRILGGGFWWDHDNTQARQFDQLGGSFEWLGNFLDIRGNAYIPTNSNVSLLSKGISGTQFINHNIGIVTTSIFTAPLTGGDFETGGALPLIGDLGLRAYAGGYYYQGPVSGGGVYGVRARAEALFTQNLWGTVAVTHDRVFGTNVTAAATIYLGTGQSPQFLKRIPMTTRLYQQMERQYRIAVQRAVEDDVSLALRAGGTGGSGGPIGTPIFVDHVDNTAPAGGDGSVLHPFNHLPTTTPTNVDIIFVRRGDGTSNNMNQGITLNNWQRLLGDGVHHMFTSTAGTFVLPGFTPGPLPTITNINPGGDGVTLASHNEVSGFNIPGASRHGIFGTGITDFNINHVNISNSGSTSPPPPVGDGIHIDNATGTGLITSSTFTSNTLNGVQIASTLASTAAPLTLTVDSDRFTTNGANGLLIANHSPGPLPGNFGQTISATVTRSTFTGNTEMGIQVNDINSVTNLTVGDPAVASLGNTFISNHSAGIGYITNGTPDPLGPAAIVHIDHNTISGTAAGTLAAGDGIFFSLRGGTTVPVITPRVLNIQIGANHLTTNAADGLHMEIRDIVQVPVFSIIDNTMTNNGANGISILSANWTSTIPRFGSGATMTGNTVTGNTLNGVIFTSQDDTVDQWSLTGNKFNTNGNIGLVATSSQNAVFVLNSFGGLGTTGDQFIGNTSDGVRLTSNDGSSMGTLGITGLGAGPFPTSFIGATIESNGGNGMTLTSNNISNFNVLVQSSIIGHFAPTPLANTGDGIRITANNGSVMNGVFGGAGAGNEISSNGGNGVNMTTNSISDLTVDFDSNQISHNAADGVLATHQGGTLLGTAQTFVAPNDPFLLFGGSTVQATFNNNTISNNGARGLDINFLATAGTAGTGYVLTNNTISNNGQEGVFLQTNSGFRTNTFVLVTETPFNSGFFAPPAATVVTDGGGGSIGFVDATVANDVLFVANTNTINSNGADGMFLHVGTTGYVHGEVESNKFSGNHLTDFRTDSFITGGNTPADVITIARANPATSEQRQITLDNLARLDLRFTGNTGDSISNVSAFGATYPADSVKNGLGATIAPGAHGNIFFVRRVGLFAVEDGGTLATNFFFETNVVQGIPTATMFSTGDPAAPPFTTGGYDLAPAGTFTPPLP